MAGSHLADDERIGAPRWVSGRAGQIRRPPNSGSDPQPAGRQRPQVRDVEIRQQDLAEGPRNGGRGHQQDVRGPALGAQGFALGNPETVLFVDHGQSEVSELDRFLDQGVRPDHDPATGQSEQPILPGRRRGELLQGRSPFRGGKACRQQSHSVPERLEQPA